MYEYIQQTNCIQNYICKNLPINHMYLIVILDSTEALFMSIYLLSVDLLQISLTLFSLTKV